MIKGCNVSYIGECPAPIWRSLYYFNEQDYSEVLNQLKAGCSDPDIKHSEDYWTLIWDACTYKKDLKLINELANEYLNTFNKNPPELISTEEEAVTIGKVLTLTTLSPAESESYEDFLEELQKEPKPFLIRGPNNKTLSWHPKALERLINIFSYAEKHKILFWGENLDNIRDKVLSTPDDKRTDHEYSLLLEVLRLELNEELFFEESLNYALKNGFSPKEYYPPNIQEKEHYFPNNTKVTSSSKEIFQDGIFNLNNNVNLEAFFLRLDSELKNASVVIIDVAGLKMLSFETAFQLAGVYNNAIHANKKMTIVNATPLIRMMLFASGILLNAFK